METSIHLSSNATVLLALGAMFMLVLTCVHKAIRKMALFGDVAGWVVAVCVALLSIVGLVRFFAIPDQRAGAGAEPTETGSWVDFILLPYIVLPIALLLVLLFSAVDRVRHRWVSRHLHDGTRSHRTVCRSTVSKGSDCRKGVNEFERSGAHRITNSGYKGVTRKRK